MSDFFFRTNDAHKNSFSMNPFNILVTGTPGTGKTTLCTRLCKERKLEHMPISSLVQSVPGIQDHWNKSLQTYELTEEDENAVYIV